MAFPRTILTHSQGFHRQDIRSTYSFPSETLRLLSLKHFPKAQPEKRHNQFCRAEASLALQPFFLNPTFALHQKVKEGNRRKFFIMESRVRPLATLAQTRI